MIFEVDNETEKISTGISELDKLLKGGFFKNSVITVSGGPGSGKTVFALQFLAEGVKNDENVMYISFNLKRRELLRYLLRFDFGVDFERLKERIVIIEYPPEEIEELLKKHGAIKEIIDTTDITRIVIDPITSFVYIEPDPNLRRKFLYNIVDNFKHWDVTSLIIDNDDKYDILEIPRTMTGVESFTDGYIHLSYILDIKKMERLRGLEIIKMYGVPDDTKIHPIKITDKGINIVEKRTGCKR